MLLSCRSKGTTPKSKPLVSIKMEIRQDDVIDNRVVALLEEHIADMYATTPAESVHTLDLASLRKSDISFWVIWDGEFAAGCIALKEHDKTYAEIKSMRSANGFRGKGIGKILLEYVINVAEQRGYQYLRLETGYEDFFKPARAIYERFGFQERGPFADYTDDPISVFMEREV